MTKQYLRLLACSVVQWDAGFEVITAVVLYVALFWDVVPCSPYVKRHTSETPVHIGTTRRYIPEEGNIRIVGWI
jgi:hypothetical protein